MPMKDLLERSDSRGGHVPYAEDFFEGPEKLFEVTFRAVEGLGPKGRVGLRTVDRQVWEEMLRLVNCEIVSVVSNSFVDAYLLSESSLFVYPRRLMIKTCGTTTLLRAVNRVLEIAAGCGLVEVESLFYTRKNFLLPERQLFPHTSFADEVKVLDEIFENGTAYVLGKLNGDHLYVYMVENYRENEAPAPDQNLEILMHELDHDAAKMFYRGENFVGSRDTTIASGVQALFPTAKIDDLVFDPCGYSVNGIIDEYYFTIHVTPQPLFSFASFETNAPMKNYSNLVKQVLDIFKPGRFSVAVVANETAKCGSSHLAFDSKPAPGLVRDDKTQYDFQAYNLTYSHYEKLC